MGHSSTTLTPKDSRVWAVAGDATWAQDRAPWLGWTSEVVTYGKFDGIVADVERTCLPIGQTRANVPG